MHYEKDVLNMDGAEVYLNDVHVKNSFFLFVCFLNNVNDFKYTKFNAYIYVCVILAYINIKIIGKIRLL